MLVHIAHVAINLAFVYIYYDVPCSCKLTNSNVSTTFHLFSDGDCRLKQGESVVLKWTDNLNGIFPDLFVNCKGVRSVLFIVHWFNFKWTFSFGQSLWNNCIILDWKHLLRCQKLTLEYIYKLVILKQLKLC